MVLPVPPRAPNCATALPSPGQRQEPNMAQPWLAVRAGCCRQLLCLPLQFGGFVPGSMQGSADVLQLCYFGAAAAFKLCRSSRTPAVPLP